MVNIYNFWKKIFGPHAIEQVDGKWMVRKFNFLYGFKYLDTDCKYSDWRMLYFGSKFNTVEEAMSAFNEFKQKEIEQCLYQDKVRKFKPKKEVL